MNEGIVILAITGWILFIAAMAWSMYINNSWADDMERLNDEWYELCISNTKMWSELCKKLEEELARVKGENKDGST
jgi:hypothetical protein